QRAGGVDAAEAALFDLGPDSRRHPMRADHHRALGRLARRADDLYALGLEPLANDRVVHHLTEVVHGATLLRGGFGELDSLLHSEAEPVLASQDDLQQLSLFVRP